MPNFIVSVMLEVPNTNGDKAIEKVNEFFSSVSINGKPLKYGVSDIKIAQPDTPTED